MALSGSRVPLLAAVAVLEIACAAQAAAVRAAAPPKAIASGTGKFGDWEVRCFPAPSPAPCDMLELLTQKKTGNRIMSLSIAYAPAANRHIAQFVLPLGVSLPKGATLIAGPYTSPRLLYRHCNKTGCFIEGAVEEQLINALGRPDVQAKMTVVSDDGGAISIPFSLSGFSQAHDAMVALDSQKATAAAEAGK